jgi:hypothetical protein
MAIDSQQVGTFGMQFMDQLSDTYGDDASLETLLVVAAVTTADGANLEVRAMSADGGPVSSWLIKGIAATVADSA